MLSPSNAQNTILKVSSTQTLAKPETKIHIFHTCDSFHDNHPINKAINGVNRFIINIIKTKNAHLLHESYVVPELRFFGIHLPPNSKTLTNKQVRSKEFMIKARAALFNYLSRAVNKENNAEELALKAQT
jgi:hypothetical protein